MYFKLDFKIVNMDMKKISQHIKAALNNLKNKRYDTGTCEKNLAIFEN